MARFLKTMIPAVKLLVERLPMGLEFRIDVPMRMPIGFLSFKKTLLSDRKITGGAQTFK